MTEVRDVPSPTPEDVLLGRWELREGPSDGPPMTGYGIDLVFSGADPSTSSTTGSTTSWEPAISGGPTASGSVSGYSGVNRIQGQYWVVPEPGDDHRATGILAFGPLIMTLMAGPPAAMAAEQAFLQLLDQVRAYRLSGHRLSGSELFLLGDTGQQLARMERVSPAPMLG